MFDLVVIGAGPGGYVAAIRAAQLGLKVACVEKESALGGTCLRVGCIPSKALLQSSHLFHQAKHGLARHGIKVSGVELDLGSMLRRKDTVVKTLTKGVEGLLAKNKVERVNGLGRIAGPGQVQVGERTLECKHILIATGSVPSFFAGMEVDYDRVCTSTEALNFKTVPQHLIVIGGGVIGLELGSVWGWLGAKVSVVEFLDRILPGTDLEVAAAAQKIFEKQGMEFHLGQKVTSARSQGEVALVETESGLRLEGDRVLVAVGRKAYFDGLGLEEAGVKTERGKVVVDEHFRTNVAGLWAIGDCIPGAMLAHKAEDEGMAVAEFIATGYGHVNYDAIPAIVYTHPEIASVGLNEEQLKERGVPYRKGTFPFLANGRARSQNETDGMVKVLAHTETDRVLGVHILGPSAGDLIAECVVAMEFSASSEDIARVCHAHPTLSEVVKEAALAVDGRAIHM
ncbi:dihydrolipoyl dehydrogenase [bacterium]|nr:dihydrolipoyl dehydrogenase [bacterium]